MVNFKNILEKNFKVQKPSFIFSLHEEEIFDEKLFWEFFNSLQSLSMDSRDNNRFERSTARELFQIYDYTIALLNSSIIFNQIPGLDNSKINSYKDRLYNAVDGYFQGYVLDESLFDDGLVNPFYTK